MATGLKEEYLSEDEFTLKSEGIDMTDGGLEIDGKMCWGEPLEDAPLTDPACCGICGGTLAMPRMLYCLHVFCERCLEKKLMGEGGDARSPSASIVCPTCEFETKVGSKKVAALPLDVTKTNICDVSHSLNPTCTSCTAKEVAKSYCNTCNDLLCNKCASAHHDMRCFKSHTVETLEDMRKDGIKITIHKPLECDAHAGETIVYNCTACNSLICGLCAKNEHQGHPAEGISDSEIRVRQQMKNLLANSNYFMEKLIKCFSGLKSNLEELAHQRSAAKDLINETYQSYKAVLEKCKDEAIEEINKLYHDRFLKIMKQSDELGKTISNFEDACKYTSNLLESGTTTELMYLRKIVASRLLVLNTNIPKAEKTLPLEFRPDIGRRFEKVLQQHQQQLSQPKGRPKGRMTAYAFFAQSCREEHKKKHPGENIDFAEFSKKCALRWKTMLDKEKKRFHEMAENDKKRYDTEMQSYTALKDEKTRGKKRMREEQNDPNVLKRPLSAFFWFCNDARGEVKVANPEYGLGDIAKEVGRRWAEADGETRMKYAVLADNDKARYEKEMTIYKKKYNPDASQQLPEEDSEGDEEEDDDDDE